MNNSQQTTNICDIKYKIVFLGEMAVGKSSIIQKFTKGAIDQKYNSTVGIDFIAKNVAYKGSIYRLQLWDTAGQQRFRSLIPAYMRDAHCAVITYDVTNRQNFKNCKVWYELFKQHKNSQAITLLVANKNDMQKQRKVSYQQGLQMAKILDQSSFCQLSAKTGKGLQEMFEKIIENIFIAKKHTQQQKKEKQISTQRSLNNQQIPNSDNSKSQSRINKKTKIEFNSNKNKREFVCCYI